MNDRKDAGLFSPDVVTHNLSLFWFPSVLIASMRIECILSMTVLLSAVFFGLATLPGISSNNAKKQFQNLLGPAQKERYAAIVAERRKLFRDGSVIGIIVAIVTGGALHLCRPENGAVSALCWGILAFFFVMQWYYVLSPKQAGTSMTMLTTVEQREAWYRVYRTMQVRSYGSFAAAVVVAVVAFGIVPCMTKH